MIKLNKIQSQIFGAADAAAKDWFRRQCQNRYAMMYLYYEPGTIAFWIGEEPLNNNWMLAWSERISPGKTKEQVRQQIIEIAQKLPILS